MTYISTELRRFVIKRAKGCCEYCLVSQDDRSFPFAIDHIIAEKHLGLTSKENLAWACYLCNGYKGSDLGSIDWDDSGKLTPLYNPRQDRWHEHFSIDFENGTIKALSPEGRVTVFLLQFNNPEHVMWRKMLIEAERYPCEAK